MPPSILILTSEPLPLPGLAATGAGLRAWQLREGLRAAGLYAEAAMPLAVARRSRVGREGEAATGDLPEEFRRHTFPLDDVPGFLMARRPDVLLLQHWGLFERLGDWSGPLAIDLAGPHVLERAFWGSAAPANDIAQKLEALRRADFIVCSGRYQRHYFWPFLMQAGRGADELDMPVIPFCWPRAADAPMGDPARQEKFVYGGMLLPWQDPSRPLTWLLEAMDEAGRGELLFIGGAHPAGDVSRGRFEDLMAKLERHPRVTMTGRMAFDDYVLEIARCGWAMDVMASNAERELAFATRTVVYMAAGLGLLIGDYTEMGPLVARYGAGRALRPDDETAFKAAAREILDGKFSQEDAARGAQELIKAELATEKFIAPLAEFCRNPKRRSVRSNSNASAAEAEESGDAVALKLRRELDDTRAELAAIRGKSWVRWGERLIGLRPLWAILAFLLGCTAAPFLFVYLWITGRPKN